MANYKEMYLHLMRETERAKRIIIEAQMKCEELYIEQSEIKLTITDNRHRLETSSKDGK